jgi:sarcosine oxidase subunit alpha
MSVNRLGEPFGILLDRSHAAGFRYDGHAIAGLQGDCVASALAAADIWHVGCAPLSGRPRGLYSLAHQFADFRLDLKADLAVDPAEKNLLAGMSAYGLGERPVVEADHRRGSRFSWLTPQGARRTEPLKIWEKPRRYGFRRLAHAGARMSRFNRRDLTTEVAVVGGGAAGVAAAVEAARSGRRVILIERLPLLGGSLNTTRIDVEGEASANLAAELAEEMAAYEDRITVLLGAHCRTVAGGVLTVDQDELRLSIAAERIILATGAAERFPVFPNNDLPGVMTAGAVGRLLWLYGVRPGRRAVVMTNNSSGYGLALDLLDAGVTVRAVVDCSGSLETDPLREAVAGRGVEIGYGYQIRAARLSSAGRHIGSVSVEPCEAGDARTRKPVGTDCDLLCVAGDPVPDIALAIQAGATARYDPAEGTLTLASIPAGIHLAGAARGVCGVEAAITSGRNAGRASGQGPATLQLKVPPSVVSSQSVVAENAFVDFACEVTAKQVYAGYSRGGTSVAGLCRELGLSDALSVAGQAALNVLDFLAEYSAGTVTEGVSPPTVRVAPAPVALGVAANGAQGISRPGLLQAVHESLGATITTRDGYRVPLAYGTAASAAAAEIATVRHNAGIADMSGCAKLLLSGDGNRAAFGRVAVPLRGDAGSVRATAFVVPDGAGRVHAIGEALPAADDALLLLLPAATLPAVTDWLAPVCAAAGVALKDVSDGFAVFSLSGPNTAVLAAETGLVSGVGALPDAASVMLAGDAVRVFRWEPFGESGLGLAAPAAAAERVWTYLLSAGHGYRLKPVGAEAQTVLQIEKGRIGFGRDIDVTTNLFELTAFEGFGAAAERADPTIHLWRGVERRLVGISAEREVKIAPGDAVMRGGTITGRVTGFAFSPTVGRAIGFAYVAPDQARAGDTIRIADARGAIRKAMVTPTPFFDPHDQRLAAGLR